MDYILAPDSADVQFVEDFHDAVQFPDHFLRSLFEEVRRNAAAQDDFSFLGWNAMDVWSEIGTGTQYGLDLILDGCCSGAHFISLLYEKQSYGAAADGAGQERCLADGKSQPLPNWANLQPGSSAFPRRLSYEIL